MRVLLRFGLVLALMQRDLISACMVTPHDLVSAFVVAPPKFATSALGGRCSLRLKMKSSTSTTELVAPDVGKRTVGPDPFNKVQGDMQFIKSKIKRIADRAMGSSSTCPSPCPHIRASLFTLFLSPVFLQLNFGARFCIVMFFVR